MKLKTGLADKQSNPTLGSIIAHFQAEANDEANPILELEKYLQQSGMSDAQRHLLQKLKEEISDGDSFETPYTIKALKRIPALRKDVEAQNYLGAVNAYVESHHGASPHERALFYISECIDKERNYDDPLHEMQTRLTAPVFELYVAFQTVGCVNSDGWANGIFANDPVLVPYVSGAMKRIDFEEIGEKFQDVIDVFPPATSFSTKDPCYKEILNSLENPRFELKESPEGIPKGLDRVEMHKRYLAALERLEDGEENLWDGETEWNAVYKFYDANLDARIWC